MAANQFTTPVESQNIAQNTVKAAIGNTVAPLVNGKIPNKYNDIQDADNLGRFLASTPLPTNAVKNNYYKVDTTLLTTALTNANFNITIAIGKIGTVDYDGTSWTFNESAASGLSDNDVNEIITNRIGEDIASQTDIENINGILQKKQSFSDNLFAKFYLSQSATLTGTSNANYNVYNDCALSKDETIYAVLNAPVGDTSNPAIVMAVYKKSDHSLIYSGAPFSTNTQPILNIKYTATEDCYVTFTNYGSLDGSEVYILVNNTLITPDNANVLGEQRDAGFKTLQGYYLPSSTGAQTQLASSYYVSSKETLLKGKTIYATLLVPKGATTSIAAAMCLYNSDGTFNQTLFTQNGVADGLLKITYTATQDCMVQFGSTTDGYDSGTENVMEIMLEPYLVSYDEFKETLNNLNNYIAGAMKYKFLADVNHIIGYGQSLSTGAESQGALTTQPFNNNVLQMGNLTFSPYYESGDEKPYAGLGLAITQLGDIGDNQILLSSHGVGGYSIEQLSKGTGTYNDLLTAVSNAQNIALASYKTYNVFGVAWTQGESNYVDTSDAYKAKLVQLQKDLNTDIQAITGQTNEVLFVMYQPSSWNSEHPTSTMVTAYTQAMLENPGKFYVSNPQYDKNYFHSSNGVYLHMMNESYRRMGGEYGKVFANLLAGNDYSTLLIKEYSYKNNIINLKLTDYIEIDTDNVNSIDNYGFNISDNTITQVNIVSDRITIVCGSNVAAGQLLTYGWNGTEASGHIAGERGNIRSTETTTLSFGTIYKWLCHTRINF